MYCKISPTFSHIVQITLELSLGMVKDSQPEDAVGWDDPAHYGRLSYKSVKSSQYYSV